MRLNNKDFKRSEIENIQDEISERRTRLDDIQIEMDELADERTLLESEIREFETELHFLN